MSTTHSAARPTMQPVSPGPTRTAAVASVLFGFFFFLTVASINVPHSATDSALLAWWSDDANVRSGIISMAFAALTAVTFAVVTTHLFARVGDRSPQLTALTRTAASSAVATLLVSAALRGVIGHLVIVEDEPLPGLDVLRYSTALNYTMLGVMVMGSISLTMLGVGALVLRTGLLPRWTGLASLACGTLTLVAVIALIGAYTVPVSIVWGLCLAMGIVRAPSTF